MAHTKNQRKQRRLDDSNRPNRNQYPYPKLRVKRSRNSGINPLLEAGPVGSIDKSFIIKHSLYLIPSVIIMVFWIQGATYYPADWLTHIGLRHNTDYPPLAPYLTTIAYQNKLIVFWSLLIFLIIPYLLLRFITKNDLIPLFYVYLSGIPWTLSWIGVFGQGLTQILLLLNFLTPLVWPLTLAIGLPLHREIVGAWALSVVVSTYYKVFYNRA